MIEYSVQHEFIFSSSLDLLSFHTRWVKSVLVTGALMDLWHQTHKQIMTLLTSVYLLCMNST